jgi:hypothetical protein
MNTIEYSLLPVSSLTFPWTLKMETRFYSETKGRAVAQAVSRWLPIAAARVRLRAACGLCGGQSGILAGFLRVLRFPFHKPNKKKYLET